MWCEHYHGHFNGHQLLRLWVVIFGILAVLVAGREPPRIPAAEVDELGALSIPVSTTLSLVCEGDEPVGWKTHQRKDIAQRTYEEAAKVGDIYQSSLLVKNTVYTDTGPFACIYKDSMESDNPADRSEIYVFVNDPENIMLPLEGSHIIAATINKETVIPCQPTAKQVNVTLWKGVKGNAKLLSPNNFELQFDPTRGFIVNLFTVLYSGDFYCFASLGGASETRQIHLFPLPSTDDVPVPVISQQAKYATKGSTFVINCSVRAPSNVILFLEWTIPAAKDSKRIKFGQVWYTEYSDSQGMKYKESKLNVTISEVETVDEGTYTCTVNDHTGKTNQKAIYLDVKESGESFIKFNMGEGANEAFEQPLGSSEVKFAISFEAYPPNPSLQWYKGSQPLNNSVKYRITDTSKMSVLSIFNLARKDTGFYTLVGRTGQTVQELELTLMVVEPPDVSMRTSSMLFNINDRFVIRCSVLGCPSSNITWHWSPCSSATSCERDYHPLTGPEQNKELINQEKGLITDGCRVETMISGTVYAPGYYKCVAKNDVGQNSSEVGLFIKEFKKAMEMSVSNHQPYERDNLEFNCYASLFFYSKIEMLWSPDIQKTPKLIANHSNVIIRPQQTLYTLLLDVFINPVVLENSGQYVCNAIPRDGNIPAQQRRIVTVQKIAAPIIMETNLNNTEYTVYKQVSFEFICRAYAVPDPTILWYLNGSLIHPVNDTAIQFLDGGSKLYIARTLPSDSGHYLCEVSNRAGVALRNATLIVLDVEKSSPLSKGAVVGIVVFIIFAVIIIIVGGVFLGRRVYFERKEKQEWEQLQHQLFDQGDLGAYNPELPLDEQVDTLPYDRSWEVPKEQLKLGRTLGQGAFGRVLKGELFNSEKHEWQPVAVKMLKERADNEQRRALMQELKIMIHIGRHINVVNLIGAVTRNLCKGDKWTVGELQVLVEYCKYGNLRHFLLKHRDNFVDQINVNTGEFDRSVHKTGIVFRFSDLYSSSANTARTEINSGIGVDNPAVDNPAARVSVTSPTPNSARQLTTYDLICYSYQICSGMIYLGSKKLVHRDLALRNILLAEGDVVKICDFGLAKDVYRKNYYRKRGQGPLPYKWMAIESMRDKVYTSESDVWSFGILLWEMFTMGANPYPGMEVDDEFYNKLNNGYRMEKPQMAPNSVYSLMSKCWLYEPRARPTFEEISTLVTAIMDPETIEDYRQKNEDYLLIDLGRGNSPDYLINLSNDLEGYISQDPAVSGQDEHSYVNSDASTESPVQVNVQTGNVNYANLLHPNDPNSLNHQRALRYGEPLSDDRPELAPMIGSGYYQNPPAPKVVARKNLQNRGDDSYLDMGSKIGLNDDNARNGQITPRVTPPPRYTDVIAGDQTHES